MTLGYQPLFVRKFEVGLVQNRQQFILPEDAYPVLENAFVWREQIKRREGLQLLARLRRVLTALSLGNTVGAQLIYTFNTIFTSFVPPVGALEPNKEIEPGSLVITIGAPDNATFTDNGDGTFTVTGAGVALGSSVNYVTGVVTIVLSASAGGAAITADINYFPGLPVMGIRSRELNAINNEMMVVFDTIYAYRFSGTGFVELAPGTTWTGTDSDFFWTTNYWVNATNVRLFWATNFSGTGGDPIRYYDGAVWTNFAPQIDAAGNLLTQSLALLPFRGRLLAFNTLEGPNLAGSTSFNQRIRWSAIGSPLTANSWRDDIRGQGGFLDIPTSQSITAVGFVRDNLVIYCERSTWQLRYTGRSIAPFQIEKVNSELGAASTFSAVQFDTSLVGIGDKGVVECDSFKSDRIDIKIPDLVFEFDQENFGPERVHGIRDQQQRLAYWIYPYNPAQQTGTDGSYFPNRRLVYNYENDSWAIFTDSLTALGTFQAQQGIKWQNANWSWEESNFPWFSRPALFPSLMGGNQQGFVMYLGSNLSPRVSNDITLSITDIIGNSPNPAITLPTVIKSPDHNLVSGQIISIHNIPTGTPFDNLNNGKFSVVTGDLTGANGRDFFKLYKYNSLNDSFDLPQLDSPATYVGGGKIAVRDNFSIVSKKFNFMEQGQSIQLGFFDILMSATEAGAISVNIFINYNNNSPVNILPENINSATNASDTFFNQIIPTNQTPLGGINATKYSQRVFCAARGAFITIEYNLNNAQMIGREQESNVEIDAQILWMRPAGSFQTF